MKKLTGSFALLLAAAIVLSACSGAGSPAVQPPAATQPIPTAAETRPVFTQTAAATEAAVMTETAAVTEAGADDEVEIKIAGFAYLPARITVKVGTVVKWKNEDGAAHTVTAEGGLFDSGSLSKGRTWEFRFNQTGNFPYFCRFHPDMLGSVEVVP